MRLLILLLISSLVFSCATVKKNTTHSFKSQKSDSSGIVVKKAATITETTVKTTAPGYTKVDSLGWSWFFSVGDTTVHEQNLNAGVLQGRASSKPRRDTSGAVVGFDLSFSAVKAPEQVTIPVEIHTVTKSFGSDSSASKKTSIAVQESGSKSKDTWRMPAGVIIFACIAGAAAIIYFIKR